MLEYEFMGLILPFFLQIQLQIQHCSYSLKHSAWTLAVDKKTTMCLFGCISQTGVGVSQSPAQAASIAVGTGQITQGVDQP